MKNIVDATRRILILCLWADHFVIFHLTYLHPTESARCYCGLQFNRRFSRGCFALKQAVDSSIIHGVMLSTYYCTTKLIFVCVIRLLGYERVYLPLCKVADTPFYIQRDEYMTTKINYHMELMSKYFHGTLLFTCNLFCSSKLKGSICSLLMWADTGFWLCTAVLTLSSLTTSIVFLLCFISRSNHCYWELNACLNIQICKCLAPN